MIFTHEFVYYTAISREVMGKNVHATIPKGNMVWDTINQSLSFSIRKHTSTASREILSNFFKDQ